MSDVAYWRWFADLGLVAAIAVLATVAFVVGGLPWPVTWALGIPLLVFVPGYAIMSALFPERAGLDSRPESRATDTPNWAVFAALSVVGSALLSAVVGTAFMQGDLFTIVNVSAVLAGVTVLAGMIAGVRRALLAPYARRAPLRSGSFTGSYANVPGSRVQKAAFAASIVVLVAAVGLTAAFPATGDAFTEFYVLDENDDGELVAEGFPSNVTVGEGHAFHFAFENHEHREMTYTVVVVAQTVDGGEVTEQRRLDTFEVSVRAGSRVVEERTVVPERVGENVRIQFLMYKGSVPNTPSASSADIALQVWTDVVPADGANASAVDRVTASTGATAASVRLGFA
jgi:uncharacterized membrane protein